MTKLIDIPGAREALPNKKIDTVQFISENGVENTDIKLLPEQAHNECIDQIQSVHLEVDVEAMVKQLQEFVIEQGDLELHTVFQRLTKNRADTIAECLANQLPKWARLVRK